MIKEKNDLRKNKLRIIYGITFFILLIVEVIIAIFIHDTFIRPYVGDILVVIVMYLAIRVFMPRKCRVLPLYLFLFAASTECLQYFKLVHVLGVENNTILRILIGSTFDIKDILCYAIGCIILGFYEFLVYKKKYIKI